MWADLKENLSVCLKQIDRKYIQLSFQGIAVVKNTSSSQCFFTRLENFPQYQTKDMDNLRPILVEEVNEIPETVSSLIVKSVNVEALPHRQLSI